MSPPAANCPNCGAPIRFRWSGAVQTVCEFCRSILVRQDVNLERVGQVADLPAEVSPIQLESEGLYRGRPFLIVGRILYEYDQGGWNEWHMLFQDGSSGWLSDAQAEYAVSFRVIPPVPLPPAAEITRGRKFVLNGVRYEVTTLTEARYRGVQGELPFEYWDKETMLFADLRTSGPQFGTIDYSEDPPLLFLGEFVDFQDLALRNLRPIEGWNS